MRAEIVLEVIMGLLLFWTLCVFLAALVYTVCHYVPYVCSEPSLREGLKLILLTGVLLVLGWILYMVASLAHISTGEARLRTWYASVYMRGHVQGLEKNEVQKLFGLLTLVPRYQSFS